MSPSPRFEPLAPMADVTEADWQTFDEEVFETTTPVIVEFYTDWCDTCRELESTVEDLADEHDGGIHVVTVDVEEEGRLANDYHIADVPTFIAFFRNNSLKRLSGDVSADEIEDLFEYLADLPRIAA